MTIDIVSFREWQEHRVTKALFKFLAEEKSRIEEAMCHPHVIFDDNDKVRDNLISRFSGELGFIKSLLKIEYETLDDKKEQTNG